jgi:hypothetical protein
MVVAIDDKRKDTLRPPKECDIANDMTPSASLVRHGKCRAPPILGCVSSLVRDSVFFVGPVFKVTASKVTQARP